MPYLSLAKVAQLVEQQPDNLYVLGSIPNISTSMWGLRSKDLIFKA